MVQRRDVAGAAVGSLVVIACVLWVTRKPTSATAYQQDRQGSGSRTERVRHHLFATPIDQILAVTSFYFILEGVANLVWWRTYSKSAGESNWWQVGRVIRVLFGFAVLVAG